MTIDQRALCTRLKDRTLWYDGDSSYDPTHVVRLLTNVDVKYVDYITPDIEQFNSHAAVHDQLNVKTHSRPLSKSWNLPPPYDTLDVSEYLIQRHIELTDGMSLQEISGRDKRLSEELAIYGKKQLFDVLRTIIFIINTLSSTDTPWGVGRGSSVSSYVLYVIGVHDVDSYHYNLPLDDFLHD